MWHSPEIWSQGWTETLLPFRWRKETHNIIMILLWKMLRWRYEQDRKPLTLPGDAKEGFLWESLSQRVNDVGEGRAERRKGEQSPRGFNAHSRRRPRQPSGGLEWRHRSRIWTLDAHKLLKCFNLQPEDFGLLCPTEPQATWSVFLLRKTLRRESELRVGETKDRVPCKEKFLGENKKSSNLW